MRRLLWFVLLASPACGVSLQDYDARTAELRRAEDHVASCGAQVEQLNGKLADAEQATAQARAKAQKLEQERVELDLDTEAGRAGARQAREAAAQERAAAEERGREREGLSRALRDELSAGVLSVEDRKGAVRVAVPEEALFAAGQSALGPPGRKILETIARAIKMQGPRKLQVAAHGDGRSPSGPQLSLSVDRARRVAEHLIKEGLDAAHVAIAGFGAVDPIADPASDEGRARNRRIEVQILGVAEPPPAVATQPPPSRPAATAPPARPGRRVVLPPSLLPRAPASAGEITDAPLPPDASPPAASPARAATPAARAPAPPSGARPARSAPAPAAPVAADDPGL